MIYLKKQDISQLKLNQMIQKNIETISAKGITADMINKYSFLIEEKYFSSNGLQNYLLFQPFTCHFFN